MKIAWITIPIGEAEKNNNKITTSDTEEVQVLSLMSGVAKLQLVVSHMWPFDI